MTRTLWRTPAYLPFVASLLLAMAAAPASAQYFGQNKVQYDKFDFRVLKTEHFDIHYYPSEANAAQQVARMSERWYARLSKELGHQLTTRQAVILYASHPEFEQTNVIEGAIDEGTGGVTEGLARRVVLPLAASLGETDHVLGHELVHAFQYDMLGAATEPLPLWFIEGQAEYFSIGPRYAQTAMWLRDAAIEDHLPKIQDLDNPRYFPYRFGHALWAYIGGRWGDEAIANMLHRAAMAGGPGAAVDPIGIIETVTGLKRDVLSDEWHQAIRAMYDVGPRPASAPREKATDVIGVDTGNGSLNVGPAMSPDGSRVAFLSGRSRLAIDLYIADATNGKILHKLTKTAVDPHFQSLQFLASAGAWDPQGGRLAVAAIRAGRPIVAIFDAGSGQLTKEITLEERGEIFQPSWSPDGKQIALSAQVGGVTDLFLIDVATSTVKRLTQDAFADLQPVWSPDSARLAFVTDRYSSDLTTLSFGAYQLALMNVATAQTQAVDTGLQGNTINPQWTSDGNTIYFVSDDTGRPQVYRKLLSGGAARLTNEMTGIAGITPLSPAISLAQKSGRFAFTVFRDGGYEIHFAEGPQITGAIAAGPATADYARLPPADRKPSVVAQGLADKQTGLPAPGTFEDAPYETKFSLLDVAPQAGITTSSTFGTYASGGISLLFGDLLGNHLIATSVEVNGRLKDASAQITYLNRTSRWNWGLFGLRVPLLSGNVQQGLTSINGQTVYLQQTDISRQTYNEAGVIVGYPFSRAARFEVTAAAQRIGFNSERETEIFDLNGNLLQQQTTDLGSEPSLTLGTVAPALVRDTAAYGATGPILGQRARLEVAPAFGNIRMTTVTADFRQYVMPVQPLTLAARVMHIGRYGSGGEDGRLMPLFLGYSTLVRGYDPNSFQAGDCTIQADGSCPEFDQMIGSRILVVNAEARMPLFGFGGKVNYGPVPVELFSFFDAGTAWTRNLKPSFAGGTRDWVSSVGAGARVSVFGYFIAELNLARPLQRETSGWRFVFNMRPGF